MSEATNLYAVKSVIRIIRNQRVILDTDLAKLYGVTPKRLNEAVKRNLKRFPPDFMFRLDAQENAIQRAHLTNLKKQYIENEGLTSNWSQIATSSSKHRGTTYLPYAFTEHGIIMVASVLNSDRAIEMSVFIARAFVGMREQLLATAVTAKRLAEIEKTLLTPSRNCVIALLRYCLILTSEFRVGRSTLSVQPPRLRWSSQTLNAQHVTFNFLTTLGESHA